MDAEKSANTEPCQHCIDNQSTVKALTKAYDTNVNEIRTLVATLQNQKQVIDQLLPFMSVLKEWSTIDLGSKENFDPHAAGVLEEEEVAGQATHSHTAQLSDSPSFSTSLFPVDFDQSFEFTPPSPILESSFTNRPKVKLLLGPQSVFEPAPEIVRSKNGFHEEPDELSARLTLSSPPIMALDSPMSILTEIDDESGEEDETEDDATLNDIDLCPTGLELKLEGQGNSSSSGANTGAPINIIKIKPTKRLALKRKLRERKVVPQPQEIQQPVKKKRRIYWPKSQNGKEQFLRKLIQCDICNSWFHYGCVGISINLTSRRKFTCPRCDVNIKEPGSKQTAVLNSETCTRPTCPYKDEFTVERLIGRKKIIMPDGSSTHHWLVKWDGFDMSWCTWEPETNMADPAGLTTTFSSDALKEGNDLSSNAKFILLREARDSGIDWPSTE